MKKALPTKEALESEAQELIQGLSPKTEGATLITLSGELGAGKTTFTQAIARTLGVTESVTSPTFVLMKVYTLPNSAAFKRLVHIDAYRLTTKEDLTPLGFSDVMKDTDTLVVVEWPEQVALTDADVRALLTVEGDETRTITYGG